MAVIGQVVIDLAAKNASFSSGIKTARKDLQGFNSEVKNAASIYTMKEAFSGLGEMLNKVNPQMGQMFQNTGKIIGLSKAMSGGKGGLLGLAGGALGAGVAIWGIVQEETERVKKEQDLFNVSLKKTADLWREVENAANPYFKAAQTASSGLIAKAKADRDEKRKILEESNNDVTNVGEGRGFGAWLKGGAFFNPDNPNDPAAVMARNAERQKAFADSNKLVNTTIKNTRLEIEQSALDTIADMNATAETKRLSDFTARYDAAMGALQSKTLEDQGDLWLKLGDKMKASFKVGRDEVLFGSLRKDIEAAADTTDEFTKKLNAFKAMTKQSIATPGGLTSAELKTAEDLVNKLHSASIEKDLTAFSTEVSNAALSASERRLAQFKALAGITEQQMDRARGLVDKLNAQDVNKSLQGVFQQIGDFGKDQYTIALEQFKKMPGATDAKVLQMKNALDTMRQLDATQQELQAQPKSVASVSRRFDFTIPAAYQKKEDTSKAQLDVQRRQLQEQIKTNAKMDVLGNNQAEWTDTIE